MTQPLQNTRSSNEQPIPTLLLYMESLSEREQDVITLVGQGLTNKQIAGQLGIALSTVKAHLRNIYAKLGVSNRIHALVRVRALQ